MSEPSLVDYHCHLDLYSDYDRVLQECINRNIEVLAVTTTPAAWPRNKELSRGAPSVRLALGFHPQLIAERIDDFGLFERYLSESAFVGEVGLDASPRFYKSFDLQLEIFERIVSLCAAASPKVVSVHSVRATSKVLQLVSDAVREKKIVVVLHWFSGSNAEAKRAITAGCYFSVNHQMLGSQSGRVIATSIPIDRILTETDGPFTAMNGRPACPADVQFTLDQLADIRGVSLREMRERIAANADVLDQYAAGSLHSAGSKRKTV
ncbi:MAG TPA: Qat anti-phage system TatD family nuclease QatD [Candidatus Udaeobacter sp.]|jgi:TatD DNase family protein